VRWIGDLIERLDIKSLSLIDPAGFYIPEVKSVYDEALNDENLFQVGSPEE